MNDNTPQNTSQETPQKGVGTIKEDNIGVHNNDVAMLLDLNCATVYSKLKGWVLHNQNYGQNFHDGRYWTYNSMRAWCLDLPFLTENQIRHALERLEKAGLIVTGNYNKVAYDRTKWYSVNPVPHTGTDNPTLDYSHSHPGTIPNETGNNPEPIPILNTDINHINQEEEEEAQKNFENLQQRTEIGKVFKAYESEIGMLTPMVRENIQEALEVDNIPPDWIVTAIKEAAENNARNWKYVSAILKRWKAQGFQSNNKPQGKAKGGFKKPKYDMGDYEVSHASEEHFVDDGEWDEGDDYELQF